MPFDFTDIWLVFGDFSGTVLQC